MNQILLYKQLTDLNKKIDSISASCHSGFFNLFLNDYNNEKYNQSKLEKTVIDFYYLLFNFLVDNNRLQKEFDQSVLRQFTILQKRLNAPLLSDTDIDFKSFSSEICKIIISVKNSIEKIIAEYNINQNIKEFILKNIDSIYSICLKHFVKNLFVYGSVLNEKFNSNSDIDFLYEIDTEKFEAMEKGGFDYVDNLLQFEETLSNVLKRKVDLIPNIPIQNKYLKESIDQSKQLLYAA